MDVRAGTAADIPALVDIMFAAPSPELVAVIGSVERGRRFQRELFASALRRPGNAIFVAEDPKESGVVGFAFVSNGSDTPPMRQLALMAIRSLGVMGAVSTARRSRARDAVDIRPPPGGLHLVELHVDPRRRGLGTGGTLLAAAEEYARRQGAAHLSLTTSAANPARRLYARNGYVLAGERSDPAYTELTGVTGRVLLVKQL